MMRDELHPDDLPELVRRAPERARLDLEREVPVPRSRVIAEQVHAWLDGEGTELDARRGGGAHDVEFWKRLQGELARQRRMRVSPGFAARIMDTLA